MTVSQQQNINQNKKNTLNKIYYEIRDVILNIPCEIRNLLIISFSQ